MFETDPANQGSEASPGDAIVAEVLATGPGPGAAAALDAVDLRDLSRKGMVDYVKAWDQLTAWTTARPMAAMVALAGSKDARIDGDVLDELHQTSAFEELRLALHLSPLAVESRVEVARGLLGRLAASAAALSEGRTSYLHARALVESLRPVFDDDVASAVEQQVLPKADRPVGRFRRTVQTTIEAIDAEALIERHKRATAERTIKRWQLPDGMGCLQVEAPAPDIATMWGALTVLAGPREADDPRSLGARRVDSMLGLCLGAVAPDPSVDVENPARVVARPKALVQAEVVVDLATLLGLADNPAELRGHGQIPAGLARDWLQNASTWRRLVTDPVDGHLLDYGPVVRTAPPKLHDYVVNSHVQCCFPGCSRPSSAADLDHEPPWREDGTGGHTSSADLRPLCRRHHRLKTFGPWRLDHLPDGGVQWTSPSGTSWNIPPPPILDSG